MSLGEKIKQNRTNLNLTQQELAKKLHVSRQTISNWEVERSYPDIESLIALSELFQLSLDNLLKEDVKMVASLKKRSLWDILYYIVIVSLGVGSLIPLVVDFILNHHLSWSLISGAGCLLAAVFLTGLKFSNSYHLIKASLGASGIIYLLLFVIQRNLSTLDLHVLVITGSLWLFFYWLIICLIELSNLRFWWLLMLMIALSWPFELATKFYLGEALYDLPSTISNLTELLILISLFFVDKYRWDKGHMTNLLTHYRTYTQHRK